MKINGKVVEAVNFLLCIAVLIGIAYYTGIIEGFSPEELTYSYQKLIKNISKPAKQNSYRKARTVQTAKGSYTPVRIPESVLYGVRRTGMWKQLFNSSKKVVFYVYSGDSDRNSELSNDFNNTLANFVYSGNNYYYYELQALNVQNYNNLKSNVSVGPEKICNSLQECNEQRKYAASYSTMADFVNRCAGTMCIINGRTGEYVILRNRDSKTAINVLYQLKTSW